MTLKIKEKNYFGNCILDNFYIMRNLNYRDLFVVKGSGSRFNIFPDPDLGEPKPAFASCSKRAC